MGHFFVLFFPTMPYHNIDWITMRRNDLVIKKHIASFQYTVLGLAFDIIHASNFKTRMVTQNLVAIIHDIDYIYFSNW